MKKLKFLSLALFLMLGVVVLAGSGCSNKEQNQQRSQSQEQEVKVEKKVILVINDGEKNQNFESDFEQGMTAYSLLEKVAKKENLELKTTKYDFGLSVDQVGSKKGGENKKYWMYYIDGVAAQAAVDKQEVKEGMKVEFKYE